MRKDYHRYKLKTSLIFWLQRHRRNRAFVCTEFYIMVAFFNLRINSSGQTLQTLSSELTICSLSPHICRLTQMIISILPFPICISHEKTFPTNTNLSYQPLTVSQQLSSARSRRPWRPERAEESC